LILKQAITKQGLAKTIDKNSAISIDSSDNNCNITYMEKNYLSIEEFLESITN
jgi:hypothetical protein